MKPVRGGLRRPSVHVTAAVTASTALIHLPIFLLGGLALLIREDVTALDEVRLGAAVSTFYAVAAVASVLGGRLAELRQPRTGMVAAAMLSAAALLSLGTVSTLGGIFVASGVAGIANGIGQPSSNVGLARGIRRGRQGVAFGIKQSSVPIASLLAGFSLPLIGLTLGWRWTFGASAALVVAATALIPRRFGAVPVRAHGPVASDAPRPALLVLATGAAFGAAAGGSLPVFAVLTSVAYGFSVSAAGYLLGLGSIAGVASRIWIGWRADRRGRAHLPMVARLLAVGSVGYVMIAAGDLHPVVLVVGMLTAFSAGWGWPGLMVFAVVRLHPAAPGFASGVILAGGTTGAVVGPLCIGFIAREASFAWAWLVAGALSAVGAVLVTFGRRAVRSAIADGEMLKPPAPDTLD